MPKKSSKPTDSDAVPFSYDETVRTIESIVDNLEQHGAQSSFDEMISDVEKALALIAQCKASIHDAEGRLAKLIDASGDEGGVQC